MSHYSKQFDDWEPPDEHQQDQQDRMVEAERLAEELQDASTERAAYEGVEGDGDTGASWLANDVIIGSLPDNKLRSALARYKAIVRLCEVELAARALAPRRSPRRDRGVSFVDRYAPNKLPKEDYQPRQRRSKRSAKQQLTLAPEQMLKALEMLLKLSKTTKDPNKP